jgi:poly(3-hydroxybutyrate) depolymerase
MTLVRATPRVWIGPGAFFLFCFLGCQDADPGGQVVILGSDDVGFADSSPVSPDAGNPRNDSCDHALNDWCDEPALCAVGTDDTDCFAACETGGEALAFFAAACSHRDQLDPKPVLQLSVRQRTGLWKDEVLPAPGPDGESLRHIRIFVPPGLSDDALVPVVLMLPGNRVSHYSGPDYTELDRSAARSQFIVVYVEQPWRSQTFSWSWYTDWDWNDDADGNPDLLFLDRLVEHLLMTRPIDPQRIYLAGHSRGAAMSIIAALERPLTYAGAIPQSGFVEFGYYDRIMAWSGDTKPAFFFMHGTVDDDVCIDCRPGGNCGVTPGRRCGTVASSDAIVETLRDRGFGDDKLFYARLENVAHRWQPWLNEAWWQFMDGQSSLGSNP